MEQMTKLSCEQFLADLSTKAPVPGGGGASALMGAIGVALGHMVGSLTTGKKKYADVESDIQRLNAEAQQLRSKLETLVTADAEVFEPLSKAYGLPKDTPEQAAYKAQVMEQALDSACSVPLNIMLTCCKALELIEEYAEKGSIMAISDAGVAAVCCKAALQGASLNVLINTKSMADRAKAERLNEECSALLRTYTPKADAVFMQVSDQLHR